MKKVFQAILTKPPCVVLYSLVFKWLVYVRLSIGPVFEWSENRTEKSLFMVQNVRYIWMVRQVTWPYHLNTGYPPILSGIQMNPVFRCSVFRWLLFLVYKNFIFLLNRSPNFFGTLFPIWKSWSRKPMLAPKCSSGTREQRKLCLFRSRKERPWTSHRQTLTWRSSNYIDSWACTYLKASSNQDQCRLLPKY